MEIPDTARGNSTILRLYRTVRQSLPQWLESSTVVTAIRQFNDVEGSPEVEPSGFTSESETTSQQQATHEEAKTAGDTPRTSASVSSVSETPSWKNSGVYTLLQAIRQYVYTSWLYRWLTDEPDPAVVVIDLRETLALGPLLARLEITIREAIGVMPTSGGLRRGFQLRARFQRRPIRVVSFGLIGVVLLAFIPLLAVGETIGFVTFLLFGLLLVGLRGTQSSVSWTEIKQTDTYKTIITMFEPPDSPTTTDSTGSTAHNDHREREPESRSEETNPSPSESDTDLSNETNAK